MTTFSREQIKEVADELDSGSRCFWHKKRKQFVYLPDTVNNPGIETELSPEDLAELEDLENNAADYVEIEPLSSKESFNIMVDFAETLSMPQTLKKQLIDALNKKKPFREFKFVVDNSGEYRQKWFDFKNQAVETWVQSQLEGLDILE